MISKSCSLKKKINKNKIFDFVIFIKMEWVDSVEEFLEIVEALDTNEFAPVPPIEPGIEVQPIVLQSGRSKLRIQTSITPISTPTVRSSVGVKDLVSRIETLEEILSLQCTQLHELYSFINSRLDKLEKIVNKSAKK
jgi:hypothetical protein